jgi:type I restriction enzyme, S subunit
MSTWRKHKLSQVATIISGGTPKSGVSEYWGNDIRWITPKDMGQLTSKYVSDTGRRISKLGLDKSSAKLIASNSVILSTRAPIGHLAINTEAMSTNQGCRGLTPTSDLHTKYLYYFLLGSVDLLNELGTGTTFKELSKTALEGVEIPLPPIPEQQRIVAILDQAFADIEKVRANAEKNLKNAHELFDSYLNQVFSQRGEGWVDKTILEITSLLGDGLHGTPKYEEDGDYYFINGNNLNDGNIQLKSKTKRVSFDEFKKYKKNLNDRTVLVSINGTLGNVAFFNNEKVVLGKSACYFNLLPGISKQYIKYVIESPLFQNYAETVATGATIKNVSLKSMRAFSVPIAPENDQEKMVEKLEILKEKSIKIECMYVKKLASLDELKKSLLQKAFSGELTKTEGMVA